MVYTTISSNIASAAFEEITKDENGDPVYDALGVADKLTENNKINVVAHMRNMYNEEKQTASEENLNVLKDRMIAASYLFGLELDFID